MDFSYFVHHQAQVLIAIGEHVRLTVIILVISLAIGLPLGTFIARVTILYRPLERLFGIVSSIPSLALLACLVAVAGIGGRDIIIALLVYVQCILVGSVVGGLRQVDPLVVDAARSLGISPRHILLEIEYPVALPVILAGLRTATAITIAVTTVAALSDAGGVGRLLFDGINDGSNSEIEVGVVALLLLAMTADIVLRLVHRTLPATRARAAARR